MKICDRCGKTPIVKMLVDPQTDEGIDLCVNCANDFDEWRKPIEIEDKKRGRPRKDGSN